MQQSFIETQFPVSKLSKESFKERDAKQGQTLTGLGKWWGRKPLVMVRATILGLLLPASINPKKDRDIFLKLMTMDDEGLWLRKTKNITASELFASLPPVDQEQYFEPGKKSGVKFKREVTSEEKGILQRKVFDGYTYDQRLSLCCRPEHIEGPSEDMWADINGYLGTSASNLAELIAELGIRRFGHIPQVGDAFCGGGSVPFEAARIGCDSFASDLNPVAALLTWGALNIIGGGEEVNKRIVEAKLKVYHSVDKQIRDWKIEHNEQGWQADMYMYCTEAHCPEPNCNWQVPLSPSWVVADASRTIVKLVPDARNKRFDFKVVSNVSDEEFLNAKNGSVHGLDMVCPACKEKTSISTIRGDRGASDGTSNKLRPWDKADIVHRPNDIFTERLYCIRWEETYVDDCDKSKIRRHYLAPDENDLNRETKILALLKGNFADWQSKGYIPSLKIESGPKTDELIRMKGWTYWHHVFNPRQLLLLGLTMQTIFENIVGEKAELLLMMGKLIDYNSKLCRYRSSEGNEAKTENTFYNQALNPMLNYGTRPLSRLEDYFFTDFSIFSCAGTFTGKTQDCRSIDTVRDFWITDPPYADAVNYHELTEFFLSWYEKHLPKLFPGWYGDSKRALAVKGKDEDFRHAMVDCYRNLAEHMPDDGMQVVMFTHQDAGVWADLALILWAAGLQVTTAWTISTETAAGGIKQGNYVQGTVLLVLRKRKSNEIGFLDEITHDIKPEVEKQLQSMLDIEDKDDPNFTDSDYQLAAYAAALRVLTSYKQIEDLDVERELSRPRNKGDKSPIESIIESGVKIASNFLIPKSLHDEELTRRDLWRNFSAEEKFYIKGLEIESHGDYRQGVYQEFAKGFGLREYTNMLESGKANETRLKTASEFKRREVGAPGFGATLTRHVLFAISQVVTAEDVSLGLRWLKEEIPGDYWQQKQSILALLRYIAKLPIEHWREDSRWAQLLAGTVENDAV